MAESLAVVLRSVYLISLSIDTRYLVSMKINLIARQEVRDRTWYESFGRTVADSIAARVATIIRGNGLSMSLSSPTQGLWSISLTLQFNDKGGGVVDITVGVMSRISGLPADFRFRFLEGLSAEQAGEAFAKEIRQRFSGSGLVF